jgi:putative endonuclease
MSVARGHSAEVLAAEYLKGLGFHILERNWRTRWCEVDLIARRHGVIHLIEVKYRARSDYGTATEFVTADKRIRLERAALAWTQLRHYTGPYQIDVVAIDGDLAAPVITYLPNAVTD